MSSTDFENVKLLLALGQKLLKLLSYLSVSLLFGKVWKVRNLKVAKKVVSQIYDILVFVLMSKIVGTRIVCVINLLILCATTSDSTLLPSTFPCFYGFCSKAHLSSLTFNLHNLPPFKHKLSLFLGSSFNKIKVKSAKSKCTRTTVNISATSKLAQPSKFKFLRPMDTCV